MDRSGLGAGTTGVCGWGDSSEMIEHATNHGGAPQEDAPQNEGAREPVILRANGNVQILLEASAAHSSSRRSKRRASSLRRRSWQTMTTWWRNSARNRWKAKAALVVSDPDHLIADVIVRWRKGRS